MPDEAEGGLTAGLVPVVEPVIDDDGRALVADEEPPEQPEIALCLSGGGYRAMLFHLGGLIRLNEIGRLRGVDRVSSVSGGSITAGLLGLSWRDLIFDENDVATNLRPLVVDPIRELARHTIDRGSIVWGLLRPGRTIGQNVARAYDERLYRGGTLQDLPDDAAGEGPRFVINATNVQTGKLFRFSRPFEGDYTVGLWRRPATRLADAVAASSAFPPVLSPHTFEPSGEFDESTTGGNRDPGFRSVRWLSDGGVYDNLGLETAWKRASVVLVSDGGGVLGAETEPHRDWARHGVRVTEIIDGQVRALRKRQLIDGFERQAKAGTYWGIRSDLESYGLTDPLPIPEATIATARTVPTRLAELDDATQAAVINWGYVIADTALRRWVYPGTPAPNRLPID